MAVNEVERSSFPSDQGSLTVGGSAVGVTDASGISSIGDNVVFADFHHDGGGKIYHNSISGAAPTQGSTNGDIPQVSEESWRVWGKKNIENWQAIKATGESDATVSIILYELTFG